MVSGVAAPKAEVLITLTPAGGGHPMIMKEYTHKDGIFELDFGSGYYPVSQPLHPGDVLQAEAAGQVFSITLLQLSADASLAPPGVSGQAPPGAVVEVCSYAGPLVEAALPL